MKRHPLRYQMGLSLIELMVAMLISLLLLGGVLQVFLSSKDLYRTNTAVARVQEGGRFATEFLTFDIRQAGYKGDCLTPPLIHLDETSPEYQADLFDMSIAIRGWEGDTNSTLLNSRLEKTDAILIKHAGQASDATAKGSTGVDANTVTLNKTSTIPAGSLVLIADSKGCDLFQKTNDANSNSLTKGAVGSGKNGSSPGNAKTKKNWTHEFDENMQILMLQSFIYYLDKNIAGMPSLYRLNANNGVPTAEELVEGVIDLQVTYGIDNDGDRQADAYIKAGTNNLAATGEGNWSKVVSARVSLLVVSTETNVLDQAQQFTYPAAAGITKEDDFAVYDNGVVTLKDNRVGQVFTTTVAIRNRLP